MAKGARASTIKANNQALKRNVFGPVEDARTARLSAKLLELASQPKPETQKEDANMEAEDESMLWLCVNLKLSTNVHSSSFGSLKAIRR